MTLLHDPAGRCSARFIVVAVLTVSCASAAERESAAETSPLVPPEVAPALAVLWQRLPRTVTKGRCWVRIEEATDLDYRHARTGFRDRNGPGWSLPRHIGLDSQTGFVRIASHSSPLQPPAEGSTISEGRALAVAKAFLKNNADLLGLRADDFRWLGWKVSPPSSSGPPAAIGRRTFRIASTWHRDVAADMEQDPLRRHPKVSIRVLRNGQVEHVVVNGIPPAISVCRQPTVSAQQARHRDGIVGRRLGKAGHAVRASDVGTPRLRVRLFVKHEGNLSRNPRAYVYRLVWEVPVSHWSFMVDAVSGELVDLVANFAE